MTTPSTNGRLHAPKPKERGIAWTDELKEDGPELFVLRMKGNKCLTFTCYARKFSGVKYHWINGGSSPHLGDEKKCPGCKAMQAIKYKYYVHCYCSEMRQEVFLELTPGACKALRDLLIHRPDWRGAVFQLKRIGADNGKLVPHILAPMTSPEALPAEKNPQESLLKLWGLTQEQIDEWLGEGDGQGGESDFH